MLNWFTLFRIFASSFERVNLESRWLVIFSNRRVSYFIFVHATDLLASRGDDGNHVINQHVFANFDYNWCFPLHCDAFQQIFV